MGMAFFGPALVLLTLFLFLPMLLTFGFSFTDYFALNPELTHFVGLENYINIFKDDLFVQSFLNTVKFVIIIVPCQCIGALVLALAINKAAHCKKYFKVAFFVPVVMSLAVVSTLWMQIYSPEGILNTLLANFGIDAQPFIHSASQALPSIAIMSVWQGVGYQMIIFLGGLQNINPALYEAAEMDHASAWQKFKDITLPELELYYRKLDLYFSFAKAFGCPVDEDKLYDSRERVADEINEILLHRLRSNIRFCARCGKALPLHHRGRLCDECFRHERKNPARR